MLGFVAFHGEGKLTANTGGNEGTAAVAGAGAASGYMGATKCFSTAI